MITGTLDSGQGHASAFAQILGGELGLPVDTINLLQGDSAKAQRLLGWQPTVSFRQLVRLMVEADWQVARRERVVKENSSLITTGNCSPFNVKS